jgi:hypothetical protein
MLFFQGLAHLHILPITFFNSIMPHVKVFARVSPKQKVILSYLYTNNLHLINTGTSYN